MLMLNRKLHRAHTRVREGNFSLQGLMGFDLHGKTVGLVGTGRIAEATARILAGFGCRLLGHDVRENPACVALGMRYVELPELFSSSDVISLHCPLTPATHHLVDDRALALMKPGVMLINTSRGAVIDTRAAIRGLKSGRIGYLGLDVYEEEGDLFFQDLSETVIQDDVFSRLQTFPNVVITAHQAFFTREAVQAIQTTTLENASGFERGSVPQENVVGLALVAKRS
jgi:D-lactate dehydrogenase